MNKAKILLVDDDPVLLTAVSEYLRTEGYKVIQAANLKSAYRLLEVEAPDLTIVDYLLPDGDALQFLDATRGVYPSMKSIVLTGNATIEVAVKAIKQGGAANFLTKPVDFAVLSAAVRGALESQQNLRKQLARKLSHSSYEKNPFEGTSEVIQRLSMEAHKIVHTGSTILIQGETGTGKGVLARWLHENGPRAEEELVDVNCAGLSNNLLESQLFGYEKGAFTGADASRPGLVEAAHRGILFLDELGEMDLLVQPKLLKVLEEHRFRRLGDVRERVADIQIIAATNRDLEQLVEQKRFRQDLFFRIDTLQLWVPPLRERREDIPALANSLLKGLANELARDQQELSHGAATALKEYNWPGNIRQLRNVLERVALICEGRVINAQDLVLAQRAAPSASIPLQAPGAGDTLAEVERQHIIRILQEESGKVAQAARRLGIPRSTLYQKIKLYGIQVVGEFRKKDPLAVSASSDPAMRDRGPLSRRSSRSDEPYRSN